MRKSVLRIWVCIIFFVFCLPALGIETIQVDEIKICKSIKDMEPVESGRGFREDVKMLYCFTKLRAGQETGSISHIWYYKDKEMAGKQLPIKGGTWSTWSSNEIPKGHTGKWRVDVIAPSGNLLASREFRIYNAPKPENKFVPEIGMGGKDVPWVPTFQPLIDRMLEMANVTPDDYVIDLGSGDGIIVRSAAMLGARGLGIEFNPYLVRYARQRAAEEGISHRAEFINADIFKTDFSNATVLTLFMGQKINEQLRPKILDMKPGTRVVSNTFHMGEWTADKSISLDDKNCTEYCSAHLWIVPAKVKGVWKLPSGELAIEQNFQMISGSLNFDGVSSPLKGRMMGNQLIFTADGMEYTGIVSGNSMELEIKDGSNAKWTANLLEK